MGVTILTQFPTENKTGTQVLEMLSKRILALGSSPQGHFLVDCETYTSVPQLGHQRTVHVLHNSEQPATVFSLLETGTKTIPLATDGLFDLLMMKMSHFYTSKKLTKAECKGPRYEVGDFCVKLGTVTVSSNFKGVLVEVEYRPCVVPALCWDLLKEFIQGFLGLSAPLNPPNYLQNRMQDVYSPIDTIHQYLEHFTVFRKSLGVRP
ncbi:mediator of RNA polymerase II transcription subunit 20 [Diorhabda carinulata]|uniref:mediator of RNA polymerase II transcription subunit 20 n=1 Tax=Diorhabda sublineata TaxID=1163346 RepID=UPI0024E17442|nr:mediator of RNA polymerase II transcription subunit 20 [Diorhabda sublineata]XP_057660691.1 mediator of RNA polymerase II transcription subunit 20 [Diorhabda carinulata]